jgi:hypothetical protein
MPGVFGGRDQLTLGNMFCNIFLQNQSCHKMAFNKHFNEVLGNVNSFKLLLFKKDLLELPHSFEVCINKEVSGDKK